MLPAIRKLHQAAILIILGALLFASSSVFATSEITMGSGVTGPGGSVNLPISLTTDDHVAAMQVDVQFDAADVTSGAVSSGTAYVDHILAYNVVSPGVLRLVIYSPTNAGLGSGTLANIQFDVAAEAALGFSDVIPANDLLADDQSNLVVASSVAGSIEISDSAPQADLQVDKTVSTPTVEPGGAVTYVVTVTNNGPNDVLDANVVDTLPEGITNSFWSCSASAGSSCTIAGDGDIDDLVEIDVGGSVTYSLSGTFDANLAQDVTNTAQVIAPDNVQDPNFSNNVATVTSEFILEADIYIDKQSVELTIEPGGLHHYTIIVGNSGPDDVSGVTITDNFPGMLSGISWTCQAAGEANCGNANGSGSISELADLPSGSSVTYQIEASVSVDTDSSVSNVAFVTVPAELTDPDPSNNVDQVVTPVGEANDTIFIDGFEPNE